MREFSTGNDFLNVIILAVLVSIMGILGNMTGYWFGRKSGNYLFKKEDLYLCVKYFRIYWRTKL